MPNPCGVCGYNLKFDVPFLCNLAKMPVDKEMKM